MTSILFICTGNYYRSRTAEILFNHFAKRDSVPASAFSRGFRLNPAKNKGILSPHAVSYLSHLEISAGETIPRVLQSVDLERAGRIIVLDEKEHRPMMKLAFPEWEHSVEYWQFEDDYLANPEDVLPALKEKIENLLLTFGPLYE